MSTEIERKFLVAGDFRPFVRASERIAQGYLCTDPERTVRIRLKGEKGYITLKGAGNASGTSRHEWEYEIPGPDARELLTLCISGSIDKTRHYVPAGKHTFEVDVFYGSNEGLIVAEIELTDENEAFEHPVWLGKEVTGDNRYYNVSLSKNPYKNWK